MPLEVIVLIGLQASGKTTFRMRRFDATHVVVSKDLLRNNRRPARRQAFLIQEALSSGRSVVVDNTNPRLADRLAIIDQARLHGARVIGYYFPATVEESLQRNAGRSGRALVPVVGIYATAKVLVPPVREEGFDELYSVQISGSDFTVRELSGEAHET